MIFGEFLGDIKKEPALNIGNLVYAGKILGLQSYGTPNKSWLPYFKSIYKARMSGNTYLDHISELSSLINVPLNDQDRITGQLAYDIAATSQRAFEEIFFELVDPIVSKHPDLPLCIVGGCALNIVLNTKVKERYNREVFVGPNPNDCGLSVGMIANFVKPENIIDVTYKGPELLDGKRLPEFVEKYLAKKVTAKQVASLLETGKILGVVQGRSEHGPRALGNRSIICNPTLPDMKNALNLKVKNREWYRPFAPIVRLEDVSEYFEWTGESRWMNFCPKVKEEYLSKIPAIVHVDNTARVQTITRSQNEFLYDVLTEFKELTGIGVLLNTSFNVDGKPILSTVHDALKVFENTQMDALYVNEFLFDVKRGASAL
jgi:carbamoyltransferase